MDIIKKEKCNDIEDEEEIIDLTISDNNNNNNNNNNNSNYSIFSKNVNTNFLYLNYIKPNKKTFILGVDPGEIYFILSIYEPFENKKMIDCYKIELRKPKEDKLMSDMLNVLNKFYYNHGLLWQNTLFCVIEGQFDKAENVVIEKHFTKLIKPIKTIKVQSRSIRSKYPELKKGIDKKKMSKYKIRKTHKQNAIDFALNFTTEDCIRKIQNDPRKHDYMEGCIFAKYGFEFKNKD
jgi:hypothetical protein